MSQQTDVGSCRKSPCQKPTCIADYAGAQQAAKQQETPQDDAAVDAMHLDEGMHETPEDAPKAPKQKPVRKAAAKKAPVKRSARKAKPAKVGCQHETDIHALV